MPEPELPGDFTKLLFMLVVPVGMEQADSQRLDTVLPKSGQLVPGLLFIQRHEDISGR